MAIIAFASSVKQVGLTSETCSLPGNTELSYAMKSVPLKELLFPGSTGECNVSNVMFHHLSSCIRSWECFNCMTQNISDQNPRVIWEPPAWMRLGEQQVCCSSQPLCPTPVCSHLCRQIGMLLPGREVHWEALLPGWMAQTIQGSTGTMLVTLAEPHLGLETFLRKSWACSENCPCLFSSGWVNAA